MKILDGLTLRLQRPRCRSALALLLAWAMVSHALAQEVAIPTVGDSPSALQLSRRAEDLRDANALESARIAQRLLAEYGERLVPSEEDEDRFVTVTDRMISLLRRAPAVRAEWERLVAPFIARYREERDDATVATLAPTTLEGSRAALRLAQRELEAGRPAGALAWLRHVDLDELASRQGAPRDLAFVLAIQSRAHRILGETTLASLRALELADLAALHPEVARIAEAVNAEVDASRAAQASPSPIDVNSAWHRIWRQPLAASPFSRRYLNPVDGPLVAVPTAVQAAEEGALLTVAPRPDGDRLFLSEGHLVSCVDRLSRRVRWQRDLSVRDDTETMPLGDLSELALGNGVLVVLTGHAAESRRTGEGRVVALDAESGTILWERMLAQLEPPDPDSGDGLFPHGAPLVVDDMVIVLARKQTTRRESVATLVALGLETGDVRWITYLAGAGSRPMSNMRPLSSPLAAQGSIFVALSVGAIARVDAADGSIRWLRRSSVPVAEVSRVNLPWETGTPALLRSGLVAIAPDGQSVLVLDPESGAIQRRFLTGAGEAWGSPRVVRASADGRLLLAIGDDMALFDADSLEQPRWRLSEVTRAAGLDGGRLAVRGRADFAEGSIHGHAAVVVPLLDRLLLIDAEAGTLAQVIETGRPGNALLADGQVLLAGNDRLECFMPLVGAERAVRDWMARDPIDPTRAMALLELGIQCAVPAMIFEGIATTASAIDASREEAMRSELVQRIIAGSTEVELPDADMERMLASAISIAVRPADRVTASLAQGAWQLRRGRGSEAVESWQRILASPELREAMLVTRDGELRASAAVLSRLEHLVLLAGQGVLNDRNREAESEWRRVPPVPTPGELIDFARTWVGSDSGVMAAQSAARLLLESGRPREALAVAVEALRGRSRLIGVDQAARPLLALLVELGQEKGWLDAIGAEVALLHDHAVMTGSSTQEVALLRETLRRVSPDHPAVRNWPRIGAQPSGAVTLSGRLALLGSAADAERPRDAALFVERADREQPRPTLALRRGTSLDRVWSRPLDHEEPVVVAFNDSIVLWVKGSGADASLISLNPADGSTQWEIPAVGALFDPRRVTGPSVVPRRAGPAGRITQFVPSEILPLRSGNRLFLVRRNGDIACVDLARGAVVWRRDGVLDEIPDSASGGQLPVAVNGWMLAVAGVRRSLEGAPTPMVAMLDPSDGEVLEVRSTDADVDWLALAPGPMLLVAVRNEVSALAPGDGLRWRRIDHRIGQGSPSIQSADRRLVVVVRGSRRDEIVPINLIDGTVETSRFITPMRRTLAGSSLRSLQRVGDSVAWLGADRLVLFDLSGRLIGQDAIAVDRRFETLLATQETLIVIDPEAAPAYQAGQERMIGSPPGVVLYQLSRRDGARLIGDPLVIPTGDRPDRWLVLDGMIVGSGVDRSTAIRMPAGTAH
ncbi:MAG: PQQ-binding-like beta-propeller repeat protein [Phycisphaeraceae bacterium]|nr:PQQ-binding-like beta-propeller repeat protein [Phycisphaeraceae bacterium]